MHGQTVARSLLSLPVAMMAALLGPAAPSAAPATDEGLLSRAGREVSETTRLADRRSLVSGSRMFVMGDAGGLYPAIGFHTRGEMGGFWTPPVKLLGGVWFALDGAWFGREIPARRFTSGWGYERIEYAPARGVTAQRVQFVPDGMRAALLGVTLRSAASRTVSLALAAQSELMPAYPWGETEPDITAFNLQDSVRLDGRALEFRDRGRPAVAGAERRDYAAYVGSKRRPADWVVGGGRRGPQEPPARCPATGASPYRCDESAVGRGAGGRLTYRVALPAGRPVTIWFAVAGGDEGVAAARLEYEQALRDPAALLAAKIDARSRVAARSRVELPGDRLLQRSVEWSKQNLADSDQRADRLRVREVRAGTIYPRARGTIRSARWIGAGFPDYPWLFATDGEYTAFASVAAGQFEALRGHLRALRDVSDLLNEGSGKVVHEVVSTGDVYFGANADPGNTDETVKFPSAVALLWRWTGDPRVLDEFYDFSRRNFAYVARELDADGDGWPEGLGNVERAGMGEEKLDSAVYLIRGLRDLADMAEARRDGATARRARASADALQDAFEEQWWAGRDAAAYADSIDSPDDPGNDNRRIFQRHWTGVTPMEAELALPGGGFRPLAANRHAFAALERREEPCYTGAFGLFHTGTGRTAAPSGNPGPACDGLVSSVVSERATFSLNSAIMAVAEGNYGRLGPDEQRRYTTANARIQLGARVWEKPGAMPEVAPSPDFTANIDRPFTERSMVLQAWGAYGVLWPVIRQQLGVAPELGNGRLAVVPHIPDGQTRIAGRNIRLGTGAVGVTATRSPSTYTTTVRLEGLTPRTTIGAVLPADARIGAVTLNGRRVNNPAANRTARGLEVQVPARGQEATLRISLR